MGNTSTLGDVGAAEGGAPRQAGKWAEIVCLLLCCFWQAAFAFCVTRLLEVAPQDASALSLRWVKEAQQRASLLTQVWPDASLALPDKAKATGGSHAVPASEAAAAEIDFTRTSSSWSGLVKAGSWKLANAGPAAPPEPAGKPAPGPAADAAGLMGRTVSMPAASSHLHPTASVPLSFGKEKSVHGPWGHVRSGGGGETSAGRRRAPTRSHAQLVDSVSPALQSLQAATPRHDACFAFVEGSKTPPALAPAALRSLWLRSQQAAEQRLTGPSQQRTPGLWFASFRS